jgi:amino acid adenylation domain-containing protein
MIVGLLGILKAGGAYLPLDPAYPRQRLAFMLNDSQPLLVLAQRKLAELIDRQLFEVVSLDDSEITQAGRGEIESKASIDNLAYIIYTSGSTGQPKGVMISHRSIVNHLQWRQSEHPLVEGEAFLQKASYGFDISVWEIFGTLMSGARLVLAGEGEEKDSRALVRLMREEGVNVAHFGPVMLRLIVNEEGIEECDRLKRIYSGGESLSEELKERVYEKVEVEMYQQYGPTEATVDATIEKCRRGREGRRIPIGRPIANTRVYILDEGMRLVPVGVVGELYIGGEGVARGYVGRAEQTAERFVGNPYGEEEGERIYRTGDKCRYRRDGRIEYIGREDEQVKVRGYRVELGEIEEALKEEEGIREAVVVVREEEEGDKRIVGYVVKEEGRGRRVEEIRWRMKERMPEWMVPSVIVEVERLPVTANGKVDRKALSALEVIRASSDSDYVEPRTPVEQILAGVWEQVLGIRQVAAHDNFFDLGGNSLLATQVMSQVRKIFEVDLPLRSIFEMPALDDLAVIIEAALQEEQGLAARPILRASRAGNAPLSFAQQRLWFIDQFEPGSYAYNMPGAIELKGLLDVSSLERSLNEIIRRHESLRTTFAVEGGNPVQVIAEDASIKLHVPDISELSVDEQQAYLSVTSINESRTPFDLAQGPLLRARLVRLSIERHTLFLTMHHIVSDGWSLDVFLRELISLYDSFSTGRPPVLPALPIQYADFAQWQRERLQGEELRTALDYWRRQLGGDLPVLQLPTDRPRSAAPTVNGAKQTITLSKSIAEALKALSKREGVTLFMTLAAAFKSLLHRYSGQEDIILGTPIANRNRAETEGLIGFFVNTLILRTDLSGDPSFRRLLARVRETAMDAYTHQDLPFEKLVEELQPERDPGTNPLFQAMVSLQNGRKKQFELPGLTMTPVATGEVTTKFIDLVLDVTDTEEVLIASLEYSTDLFDSSTIGRMLGHLETMLTGIACNPDARLSELPLLTRPEEEQVLVGWNQTYVEYAHDLCMHQLVEANAEKSPGAIAVISEGDRVSYRELNERSNQLARYLQRLDVGPETLVGICAERSVELVVGMLGILKAGGAYVPLDPEYPKDRLASILEDAQVSVQLIQERLIDRFPEHQAPVICLDRDWPQISSESKENVESNVTADNLAFVLYTSGSTGKPKGVMIPHRAACNHIFWIQHRFPMGESDRMPMKYSICFDASVFEIFYTLHAGARLIMVRQGMQQDLVYLVSLMHEHKITVLDLVGAQLQVLMDDERFLQCDWLRRVSCGNDGMLAEVKERFFKEMGKELIHFYGPCETSIGSTCHTCQPGGDHQVVSIGRPISNTQVYVLDHNLRPVPVGVAGEIVIGGIGVTRGYLKRPDVTAEKFIPNPFGAEPGDRLYRTGDMGRYRTDGTLEFAGRIDHQVKIRGFRIELGDIEAALKDHPAIQEVIVLARSDNEITNRQPGRLAAAPDAQVDPKALAEQASLINAEAMSQLLAEIEAMSEAEAESSLAAETKPGGDGVSVKARNSQDFEITIPLQGDRPGIQPDAPLSSGL